MSIAHQVAITVPEAAQADLGGTRTSGGGDIASTHLHHRAGFDSLPRDTALHIFGDDAVVNGDVTGRTDQVALFQSHLAERRIVVLVSEESPMQLGLSGA